MQDVQQTLQELQDTLFQSRMAARTLSDQQDPGAVLRDLQANCLQYKQHMHELVAKVTQAFALISRVCDALSEVTDT